MTLADVVASALRGGHVSRRTFNSAAVSSGLVLAVSSLAARAEVFGPSYLMEEEFDGISGPAMIFRPNNFEPAGYVVEEFYDSFNALRSFGLDISPTTNSYKSDNVIIQDTNMGSWVRFNELITFFVPASQEVSERLGLLPGLAVGGSGELPVFEAVEDKQLFIDNKLAETPYLATALSSLGHEGIEALIGLPLGHQPADMFDALVGTRAVFAEYWNQTGPTAQYFIMPLTDSLEYIASFATPDEKALTPLTMEQYNPLLKPTATQVHPTPTRQPYSTPTPRPTATPSPAPPQWKYNPNGWMSWPLPCDAPITSITDFRGHPNAMDIRLPRGWRGHIYAAADGVIGFAGAVRHPLSGEYNVAALIVHTRDGKFFETRYAHLSRIESGIKLGVTVKEGQVIGYAGGTDVLPPHLHFQLNDITNPNKIPVDPVQYMKYTREAMYDINRLREVFQPKPKDIIFKETIGRCPGGN